MVDIKKIVQVLNAGGVIILPTETVYGLICDATNPRALLKIYEIKGRPIGKSFPLLVRGFAMLTEYANFSPEQKKFIAAVKKPTSFVLKAKNLSPLASQKKTALFRISKHRLIKKIFKSFDRPLVATSANLSGGAPLTDPRKYKEVFGEKAELIDEIVFEGVNRKKKPSTIVDLTKRPFKVLR